MDADGMPRRARGRAIFGLLIRQNERHEKAMSSALEMALEIDARIRGHRMTKERRSQERQHVTARWKDANMKLGLKGGWIPLAGFNHARSSTAGIRKFAPPSRRNEKINSGLHGGTGFDY